jgi:hypothetical protein
LTFQFPDLTLRDGVSLFVIGLLFSQTKPGDEIMTNIQDAAAKAAEAAKEALGKAVHATKDIAEKAMEATKEKTEEVVDITKEFAHKAADVAKRRR